MRNVIMPGDAAQGSEARLNWAVHMTWHDLLFAHWPVAPSVLRPFIPEELELQTHEGQAWLGVTPFWMSDVRPRLMPRMFSGRFEEINVRTYVSDGMTPGVWFFSLDAHSRVAAVAATLEYGLNYFIAEAMCWKAGDWIEYRSKRTGQDVEFQGRYRPVGEPFLAEPGTLEHFLAERYHLYSRSGSGEIYRTDIDHEPWSLHYAEAQIDLNTMTRPLGLELPTVAPHLMYGGPRDVVAALPAPATGRRC